jgi:hypothetical protein
MFGGETCRWRAVKSPVTCCRVLGRRRGHGDEDSLHSIAVALCWWWWWWCVLGAGRGMNAWAVVDRGAMSLCSILAKFRDSTFNKQRPKSGGAPCKAW